ncbi:tetratricopeptide repeat protein [Parasphingorhabdus cellanae]|uniref:Tetratricopeptide repeat protein n=1 Tax=Parasphingorhabdus cellanae TaxID=2806553 RepID=A0ABX7T575_9SPHN|nr:tetratricopeptide repeat protein [Parasphingorhabdus cellanae]QTD55682.1 tetratricopeptide repeat protein [Parasphingorhabdus cellanae]
MTDAEAAFADNDYRSARIYLLSALKENSADPKANLLFAKTQLRLGDGVAAEAALKKLADNKEYRSEARILMAHALFLRDMPARALALTENPDPDYASLAYWVKAQALLQLDQKEGAVAALSEGLAAVPNDPVLLALRGNYEMDSRNISAARRTATLALKYGPDNLDALLLSGQLALMRQDLPAAKVAFDKALKLYPDSITPLFSVAAVNADLGNDKDAKAGLKRVLELAPGHPMALFLMARLAFNDGNLDRAHDLVQGAGETLDDVPGVTLLRGEIAYLKGNHEQAIDQLRRFLSDMPGHVQGTTVLGHALAATGNEAEAYQLVKPAANRANATPQLLALAAKLGKIQNDPAATSFAQRAEATGTREDIALKMTEAGEAIANKKWQKADAIYADLRASGLINNAIIMNNSALVQLELGNEAQAVKFARAAAALTPDDPNVLDTLGWTLLQSGQDKAEALKLLRQASARAPGNLEIRWHLANALAANGQAGEAKQLISGLKAFASSDQQAQIDALLARL